MRWLLFLLLCELHQIWASSEDLPCLPTSQGTVPFRCLQISSFANSSGWRTDISLWLGELLTHTWKNDSNSFRFLKPWSQGTFTHKQWQKLQHLFQVYRSSFTRDVQEFAKMLQVNYPFDIQMYVGCDVKPKSSPEVFLHVAFQGTEILSFQGTCWVPAPDAPQWVDKVCEVMNQDRGTRETVQWLLNDTCPEFVRGIVEMGKSELEKQVKPVAWLSRGPALGPGRLLLVCHVSGFYPKPVQVTWMRGEQKQPGTQQGDILPNADGTWSLQVSLDVVSGEAAGLTCHIKHSSLGDQDIILYWEVKHVSVGLIVLVILLLLLIGGGLFIRFKKPCSYQDIL